MSATPANLGDLRQRNGRSVETQCFSVRNASAQAAPSANERRPPNIILHCTLFHYKPNFIRYFWFYAILRMVRVSESPLLRAELRQVHLPEHSFESLGMVAAA
jgi:hypothetical protein